MMPVTDIALQQYARVIIEAGVNLYRGQCLNITAPIGSYAFALTLADAAYRKGAKFVDIVARSNALTRSRVDNAADLEFLPSYDMARSYEQLANDWAFITIDATEEIDALKGADPNKLKAITRARRQAFRRTTDGLLKHKHAWCIVAFPGPNWAARVFHHDSNEKNVAELWRTLADILHLGDADPVVTWKNRGKALQDKAMALTRMNLDRLCFRGPGIDLSLGLNRTAQWTGGSISTPDGRRFLPNIPTEEIFTTPDYRRTSGTVHVTRPIRVMEVTVEDAWFRFDKGRVVEHGARSGADILERFLHIDRGASFVGEIALVDIDSPIFRSGLQFNSILYDENALTHLALGNGFPSCFRDGTQLTTEERKRRAGCNVSLVHTDFMIGSDTLCVSGYDRGGRRYEIVDHGHFCF